LPRSNWNIAYFSFQWPKSGSNRHGSTCRWAYFVENLNDLWDYRLHTYLGCWDII